jgi:hypothetical protein
VIARSVVAHLGRSCLQLRLKARTILGDCSGGCKWYHTLSGPASLDWGVCGNPASHRAGLLTFEHQGCPEFERE